MIRVYYRVSTDKQDFEAQDHGIQQYMIAHSITPEACEIYKDMGISGTTTKRPEYQRLLAEVQEGDVILVYEFSRLWRDMEEQSRATKMFLALGVQISSVTEGNIKTEEDTLTSDLKGVINQHEARRTKRRSREGIKALQDKCAKGEAIWNGRGQDKQPRKKEGYLRRWQKQKV